ncbi:MAG: universal stress protein, partial [Pseudomonadales bacterium]|nr:universal stress protein [Pseudomonadales bacterium]
KASNEIRAVAEKQDIDRIVLGTHGQHGLQLLLGSTANSVLHGVSCDVLAVRVKDGGES